MYGEIKLFAGTASEDLAKHIADYLNITLSGREIVQFPNENLFIQLKKSVRGQDVFVIQATARPVHRNLMELLILLQTLRLDSASRVTAVFPYMAYARSDKKDKPRVPITARLIADMIQIAGADRYITLDLHAGQIQGFFSIPGDVLSAFHIQVDYLMKLKPEMVNPVVVATDLGFAKKARNYAAKLNTPIAFVEKRRSGEDAKAEALTMIGNVSGCDVILVDDEIDTAGSMAQAVSLVKTEGARKVYMMCVHPIFSPGAMENLSPLPVEKIVITDSICVCEEHKRILGEKLHIISVAPLLGEVIRRAHEGRSVGEMFHE